MPRPAKVAVLDAVNAICLFEANIQDGKLPAYTDQFYKHISNELKNAWSAQDVYTNLREDRRGLRTQVFEKLGIKISVVTENSDVNLTEASIEWDDVGWEPKDFNETEFTETEFNNNQDEEFNLCIKVDLWNKMKPVKRIYKNREYTVLPPGVWSDIVADEFWFQFRMPCAFSFKQAPVSFNPEKPFISIQGKCKSKKCNNQFYAIAKTQPCDEADLWLKVKTKDTIGLPHEAVKRQLRNEKRKIIGQQVLKEGVANCRRTIARKVLNLGNAPPPILYNSDVLRKLMQECISKEFGIDPADGNNPALILEKLKYRAPYSNAITFIALNPFIVHYLLPEQISVLQEYRRVFKNSAPICLDSTSSLAKRLQLAENIQSGNIFLFEIVINFLGITVSVGQMLSSKQDANTILHFLNCWLMEVDIVPPEIVSDYSKALLAAESRAFNQMPIKEYIRICFAILRNEYGREKPRMYIRIDVAHLIAIFCRLKCFNSDNRVVKDFLIRCVALMISCDDFNRFEEILQLTLTLTIHRYGGTMLGSSLPSPAEQARSKLLDYIAKEEHEAMKLVSDECNEEYKTIVLKLSNNGLDPQIDESFLNEQPDSHASIDEWVSDVQRKAERSKDVKTDSEQANPYRLEKFYKHLLTMAKQFPLWTSVMRKYFNSPTVRPTSCYVEGDFGELKNNVLKKRVHGPLRADKLFRFHFEAIRGQTLIAASLLTERRINNLPLSKQNKVPVEQNQDFTDENSNLSSLDNQNAVPIGCSTLNDDDLNQTYVCEKEMSISGEEDGVSCSQNLLITLDSVDTDLNEKEVWRNKGEKVDLLLNQCLTDAPKSTVLPQSTPHPHSSTRPVSSVHPQSSAHPQSSTKSSLKAAKRKPSRYFRPYPDFNTVHTALVSAKKVATAKNFLLQNGSKFRRPVTLNNRKIILKNTCSFGSIVQILTISAIDCEDYFNHVLNSGNESLGFITVLIDSGVKVHVYIQRCSILQNFVPADAEAHNINAKVFKSFSPLSLRSLDVTTSIPIMWNFIMENEPTMVITRSCQCGYRVVEKVLTLHLWTNVIQRDGYRELEKAIKLPLQRREKCKSCTSFTQEETHINAHVLIETDIFTSNDEGEPISMTCKVTDFPVHIFLQGQKLRLTGVIAYRPGHFYALCRRITGRWEVYDGLASSVRPFKMTDNPIPQAVIYIKVEK